MVISAGQQEVGFKYQSQANNTGLASSIPWVLLVLLGIIGLGIWELVGDKKPKIDETVA